MSIKKITNSQTEASLEARIRPVLRNAFPWLKDEDIKHQETFSIKFGRNNITINGIESSKSQARSDIIIYTKGKPLAILELKRPGCNLTTADEEQGLSYARMHSPMPPLVILTNGGKTKILATYTGVEWKPDTPSETEMAQLINSIGKIAEQDIKQAVDTLLGPDSNLWMSFVNTTTKITLSEQTGKISDLSYPFTTEFNIPRESTEKVLSALDGPKKIVIIDGPPLVGKSNIVYELAVRIQNSADLAMLFIEADSGESHGVFQNLANIFSQELGFTFSKDDIMTWLRRLSNSTGPKLILAIDGIGPQKNEVRRDIETLANQQFGSRIKIILTCDDTISNKLTKKENSEKPTGIGRCATKINVEVLNDSEYSNALKVLYKNNISLMLGAHRSPEFRQPSILRALAASTIDANNDHEALISELPSLLGPELLLYTRQNYKEAHDLRNLYQDICEAVVADYIDSKRSTSLSLASISTFMIRRKELLQHIDHSLLKELLDTGLVKMSSTENNQSIIIIQRPQLLASEISSYLSTLLPHKIKEGAQEAVEWLVRHTTNLPFGDLIASLAILDTEKELSGLPLAFISHLIENQPQSQRFPKGTKFATHVENFGLVQFTIEDNDKVIMQAGNRQEIIDAKDIEEQFMTYNHLDCWLILSHLASHQLVIDQFSEEDLSVLTQVGSSPITLRKYSTNIQDNGFKMHEFQDGTSIMCPSNGIVEPITLSIFKFLRRDRNLANVWLNNTTKSNSIPLLSRILTALNQISLSADNSEADWANKVRKNIGSRLTNNLDEQSH